MSTQKSVLFLGGTGYLGSAVLSRMLEVCPDHSYTVLTRSDEKAKLISELRPDQVKAVTGTHQDLELMESLASEHDITYNCADSDDVSVLGFSAPQIDSSQLLSILLNFSARSH
jgi:nucleoside-diphosphate-sugar epimerase